MQIMCAYSIDLFCGLQLNPQFLFWKKLNHPNFCFGQNWIKYWIKLKFNKFSFKNYLHSRSWHYQLAADLLSLWNHLCNVDSVCVCVCMCVCVCVCVNVQWTSHSSTGTSSSLFGSTCRIYISMILESHNCPI